MPNSDVLILFGAGASHGCQGVGPYPPPLTPTLFDILKKDYSESWGRISDDIGKIFQENFELGMETTLDDWEFRDRLLKDMAIFFSKFYVNNINENYYSKLIMDFSKYLVSRNIIVATINYECLFELAAIDNKYQVVYWGDNEGIRLLKIHGSCNFFTAGQKGEGKMIIPKGAHIHGPMHFVPPSQVELRIRNSPAPPCMSLFIRSKDVISSEDKILDLQQEFQKAVEEAKIVITIGVKPNVEDKHIWAYLAKTKATLFFIGSETKFNDWIIKYRKPLPSKYISNRFHLGYKKISRILHEYFSTGNILMDNIL